VGLFWHFFEYFEKNMLIAPVEYAFVAINNIAKRDGFGRFVASANGRWARTTIKNPPTVGVGLESASQHSVSSNSYWQMSRTPAINLAIPNA
jgi:hypothetical protein